MTETRIMTDRIAEESAISLLGAGVSPTPNTPYALSDVSSPSIERETGETLICKHESHSLTDFIVSQEAKLMSYDDVSCPDSRRGANR